MKQILKDILNRPFPPFLKKKAGKRYFSLMLADFAIIIYILQPFGIDKWNQFDKWVVIAGYIAVNAGLYVGIHNALSRLYPRMYNGEDWTVGKEGLVLLLFLPFSTVASCLYLETTVKTFDTTLNLILQLQFYNLKVALPFMAVFGLFISYVLKSPPAVETAVLLLSPGSRNNAPKQAQQVYQDEKIAYYIESKHNDSNFHYLIKGEHIITHKRQTLKKFEQLTSNRKNLIRCHNSFIVNIDKVQSWQIVDHKFYLQLKDISFEVPVSNKYRKNIEQIINQQSIPHRKERAN